MNSPQSYFLAWALATGVSLIVGIPATWRYGLTGAIWGSNTADIFSFIFIFIILRRKIARYPESAAPSISWRGAVPNALPGESVAE